LRKLNNAILKRRIYYRRYQAGNGLKGCYKNLKGIFSITLTGYKK
jgi:hypothetical protein